MIFLKVHFLAFFLGKRVALVGLLGKLNLLACQVVADGPVNQLLLGNMLLQERDAGMQLGLLLQVLAVTTGLLALNLTLQVLNLEFGFDLGLVDALLQLSNLLLELLGVFGVVVHTALLVFNHLLDLLVVVLFLLPQFLESVHLRQVI